MSSRSLTAVRARSGGAEGPGDVEVDGSGVEGSAVAAAEFVGAAADGDGRSELVEDGPTEPAGEAHPIATIIVSAINAEVRMPRPL